MPDAFSSFTPGLSSPASTLFAVTPDDNADLPTVTRGLEVQVAGNIHLVMADGTELTKPFLVGLWPIRVKKIFAASTTATGIYGLA